MQIDIITLFPEMFSGVFDYSIIKRARAKKLLKINLVNLRDFSTDAHHTVDDRPFGGGPGMILKIEPIDRALKYLKRRRPAALTVLLTPQGRPFNQAMAKKYAQNKRIILLCGHYEGVDERVGEYLVDARISIGDYVLTGGELPAMVVVDAVTRLLPGVLLKKEATINESFQTYKLPTSHTSSLQLPPSNFQLLEPPQYTRPAEFNKKRVPEILLSGNHEKINGWRLKEAIKKTRRLRPDLLFERIKLSRTAGTDRDPINP